MKIKSLLPLSVFYIGLAMGTKGINKETFIPPILVRQDKMLLTMTALRITVPSELKQFIKDEPEDRQIKECITFFRNLKYKNQLPSITFEPLSEIENHNSGLSVVIIKKYYQLYNLKLPYLIYYSVSHKKILS